LLVLPDLQVLETIFTLSTFSVCDAPALPEPIEPLAEPEVPAALEELDGVPFTFTSCPTCSDSFDVSPESWYVVPASEVNVYEPAEPPRQPSIDSADPEDVPELLVSWPVLVLVPLVWPVELVLELVPVWPAALPVVSVWLEPLVLGLVLEGDVCAHSHAAESTITPTNIRNFDILSSLRGSFKTTIRSLSGDPGCYNTAHRMGGWLLTQAPSFQALPPKTIIQSRPE